MSDEDFDFGSDDGFEEYDGEEWGEGEGGGDGGEGDISLEDLIHSNYVNAKAKYKDELDIPAALALFRDVVDMDGTLEVDHLNMNSFLYFLSNDLLYSFILPHFRTHAHT